MSTIHHTTMVPTKLELLTGWLPTRPWYLATGSAPRLTKVGGFRLDDPAGEVGIEFMAAADSSGEGVLTYHVPMTYRASPIDGAETALIGTSEHGVLGTRWIYDATRDPVFVAQLIALLSGKAEPQAQSISDTLDPTVTSYLAKPAHDGSVQILRATDTPLGTDLLIRAGDRDLSLRINRDLRPDSDPAGVAGHVTAGWSAPDGTRVFGHYVTVPPR